MNNENESGTLWLYAESHNEAIKMADNYKNKGATGCELHFSSDEPIVKVFVTLPKHKALEIVGYEPHPDEWLTPEIPCPLPVDNGYGVVAEHDLD